MGGNIQELRGYVDDLRRTHNLSSDSAMAEAVMAWLNNNGTPDVEAITGSTVGRIRRAEAGTELTVGYCDRALSCNGELLERWRRARAEYRRTRGAALTVPRSAVIAVDTDDLPSAALNAERSLVPESKVYVRPTRFGVLAPNQLRDDLERHYPIELDAFAALSEVLGVTMPTLVGKAVRLDRVHRWLDELYQESTERVAKLTDLEIADAADQLAWYLQAELDLTAKQKLRRYEDVSLIAVLVGNGGHDARLRQAIDVYTHSRRQPQILLLGAQRPATSPTLLGEVDRAYLSLVEITDGNIRIPEGQVVRDQRIRSFRDAAGLITGHMLAEPARKNLPHTLAIVSGPLSARRPEMLFSHALRGREHLCRSVFALPAQEFSHSHLYRYPRQGEPHLRERFCRYLIAEAEKLILTRLSGEA